MNDEYPDATTWQTIGFRPHHGINIPLFSLRSRNSCGIGEYPDLLPLLAWCRTIGFDIIQLLPLNDTGRDSSPYSALSAYALNPLYLGLTALPFVERFPVLSPLIFELQSYTPLPRIDYDAVYIKKEAFLQAYVKLASPLIIASTEYQHYLDDNNSWLPDFALYKAVRNHFGYDALPPCPTSQEEKGRLMELFSEQLAYHCVVQYLCYLQLSHVKRSAEEQHIWIKGDLPILVAPGSADQWISPELFDATLSAGAPPDTYSEVGQNWGFPLYNWAANAAQDFRWWIGRLAVAEKFYHLYRLDHIVGFFRIWAIPLGEPDGRQGFFLPEDQRLWIPQGEGILRTLIEHSTMLPIGEDLGQIPPEVRDAMQRLGICGTKVMRWERYWQEDGSFIPIDTYPRLSMTTVSTHDSETLLQWWASHRDEAEVLAQQLGWLYSPELTTEQYRLLMHRSHHTFSLFHINLLNEYFPLVDGLSWPIQDDERINVPGIVSARNWTYRFRPYVEEIVGNDALASAMKELLLPGC